MNLRKFAAVGMPGIMSVLLIGSVAYASSNSKESDSESISTQGLSVVLSASGATGNGTPNITLAPLGHTGSSFMTVPNLITITNNGTMTASGVALQLSDHHTNTTFESETWACFYSNGNVFFNEPLTTVEGYGQSAISHLTLAPGATDTYTVVYYAGPNEKTGCGNAFTGYSPVPLNGFSGQYSTTASYSTGKANAGAFALTNPAEGGSITPTVAVSYVGVGGVINQVAPFSNTTSTDKSSRFEDELETTGQKGRVTFVTTLSNVHLIVSSGGDISTSGKLSAGTYTVSGTDSDASGDTGTWTYTLTVTGENNSCTVSKDKSVNSRDTNGNFSDHIVNDGWGSTANYSVTSSNTHLHVSSNGVITSNGRLSAGKYKVSGRDSDDHGDSCSWNYTLTVSP